MSPGLSLIILGRSVCWELWELMLTIGGVEVVGDGGVFLASLWFSLSADRGLTAARFLFVGDLIRFIAFSTFGPNMFPQACASDSSGVCFVGDMGLNGSGFVWVSLYWLEGLIVTNLLYFSFLGM